MYRSSVRKISLESLCGADYSLLFDSSFIFIFLFYVTENSDVMYLFDYKMQLNLIFSFHFFVFLKMMAYICGHGNTMSVKRNSLDEMIINDWGEDENTHNEYTCR